MRAAKLISASLLALALAGVSLSSASARWFHRHHHGFFGFTGGVVLGAAPFAPGPRFYRPAYEGPPPQPYGYGEFGYQGPPPDYYEPEVGSAYPNADYALQENGGYQPQETYGAEEPAGYERPRYSRDDESSSEDASSSAGQYASQEDDPLASDQDTSINNGRAQYPRAADTRRPAGNGNALQGAYNAPAHDQIDP